MNHRDRVLSVFPTRTGLGWVIFEGPTHVVDWSILSLMRDQNIACLARVELLIQQFSPTHVVLEQFDGHGSRRHPRIRQLCREILELAKSKNVETNVYSRADIQACFEGANPPSRYEIAKLIAARIDDFAHELPPKRKIWMPEDPRMGLFNAAAVAITHYEATRPS